MPQGRCLLSRSLLGVKRTWLVAAHMSASDPKRTLANRCLISPLPSNVIVWCLVLSLRGGGHEATRVHHPCRRRGCRVVATTGRFLRVLGGARLARQRCPTYCDVDPFNQLPLMIARAKIRRAQQDKNPYCREHSESNTECHLLTPDSELCCQSLPQPSRAPFLSARAVPRSTLFQALRRNPPSRRDSESSRSTAFSLAIPKTAG
jgi:hypothetical protein